ncbi:MAG: hypothetical protein ABI183_07665, partial [Polyangiaceae bacterium]
FAPERSEISIERILKVLGTPISHDLTIATGSAFIPRAVSPSAPTLSEEDIARSAQRETMPMPAMPKVGGETMTNATLSAQNFLTIRKRRMTATYGAAGFVAISGMILIGAWNHSQTSSNAERAVPESSAPVITAAATSAAPVPDSDKKDLPISTAPALPPTDPATAASVTNASKTGAIAAPSSSPLASATTTPGRPRKRNQDLSKLFGGRE